MHRSFPHLLAKWRDVLRHACRAASMIALACAASLPAQAQPGIVVDLASGAVLYENEATRPWYPASLTKLMTVYVALSAVRDHRLGLDTPIVVSARANSMPPSKMGFRPGTQVTLANALKMLMVKSANDIAIAIAEGVSGSVEAFADDMNAAAAEIGLRQSHFVNPNGLHNPQHYSSARDMALLARALYLRFPQYSELYNIGALRFGNQIIQNHNNMLGRYPGVDGMKTGYTCPAGFNIVISAQQGEHRLIVVVLGSPNVETRTIKTAALLDRAFGGLDRPITTLDALPTPAPALPSPYDACRNRARLMGEAEAEIDALMTPLQNAAYTPQPERAFVFNTNALASAVPLSSRITLMPRPVFDPEPVFVGAATNYSGPVAQARAPHSPIGSEPMPALASAYAPKTAPSRTASPLAPDLDAVPLKQPLATSGFFTPPASIPRHGRTISRFKPPPRPAVGHPVANHKHKNIVVVVKPSVPVKVAAPLPPKLTEKSTPKPVTKVTAKEATKPAPAHPAKTPVKPATKSHLP